MREPIVKFLRRNLIELAVEFGDRVDAVGTAAVGLVQVVVLYVELLVVNYIVGSFPRRSVVVADHVNIGWGVGVHQFCRLGRNCMVSACSKLVQDVAPFMLADGSPAEVRSINKVCMERNGFTKEQIDVAKGVFRTVYRGDLNRKQAIDYLENDFEFKKDKITLEIIDFTKKSERGLA